MPFTPAHPAIVLPFLRHRYASATGLIAGSVSPDFEYFLKLSVNSIHSHTLAGIFYFDLPVTVLIALVFHLLVKRNFVENLPPFLQRRFQPMLHLDFVSYFRNHYALFIFSALIGAGSHVLWDSFTHNNTFIVENLPIYRGTYVPYDGVRYPLFYALQHISTAVGLTAISVYLVFKRPDLQSTVTSPRLVYWLVVMIVGILVGGLRFLWLPNDQQLGNWIVTAMSGLMMGTVCGGLINFKSSSVERGA